MNPKRCSGYLALLLSVVAVGACERAKSANPLSPDVAGPIPGVSITAPKPLEPSAGMEVLNDGKPQTLLIENAGTSGERQLWMQVQLASDAAFQQLTHHADRVALGEGGRTTYRLPEPLKPGHTYYWRARAMDGANTGPYSAVAHFTLIDPVVIETPTPLEPSGLLTNNRPNFVVRNGRVTGPAGNIVYRFEFGTAPDQPPAAVLTAVPGSNGTTTVTLGELPFDRTLFWRVWATDGSTQSPFSSILSFRTPAAPKPPPPPPVVTPPPGGGGGGLPGGGGGRTPDPGPGQRLPLPNMLHVVTQVANARPDLIRNSCQEHGGSWAFMDLVVDTLRTYDTRWGYNGKRGNAGDPSMDVIDYHYGAGRDEGSTEVYIIDIIGGHCGASPTPVWNDVTGATAAGGSIGRWISRGRF